MFHYPTTKIGKVISFSNKVVNFLGTLYSVLVQSTFPLNLFTFHRGTDLESIREKVWSAWYSLKHLLKSV